MASSINSDNGVVSGSAGLKSTADTSGVLALQSNGTTALTINTDLSATFAGAVTASSFSGTTTTATNLAGGSNGTIPYQSASGTTQMLAAGTSGQVLTSNGAAAPTWATPAPGAGTVTAVASGSIASASAVVINSDGTVSQATGAINGQTLFGVGATANNMYQDNYTYYACYCPSVNAVLVSYRNSSNYWAAIAGSISSTGLITWGTPIVIASSYYDNHNAVWNSSAGVGVLLARQAGNNIKYCEVTISGNTVTASGAAQTMSNAPGNVPIWCVYSASANRIFVAANYGSGSYVNAMQRTSTNYYTDAGSIQIYSTSMYGIAAGASSNGVLIGLDGSNNLSATAFTYAGTTITTGTAVTLQSSYSTNGMSIAYNSADSNYIVTYQFYNGSTGYIRANALTVSGTTITAGSQTVINSWSSAYPSYNSVGYNAANNCYIVLYNDPNNASSGITSSVTVSGTTITVVQSTSSAVANYSSYLRSIYDSGNAYSLLVYKDGTNDYISGRELTLTYSGNASQALLGFSSATYTNGQTATINTVGSTSTQSGLTPATKYYLGLNGSLSTVANSNYAGLAVTSTKLAIKG